MPEANDNREKTRRIARNTALLYIRMIFLMLIGLYTSRVVLRSLGTTDFGIYGAVAGVVTMFTILTGSMGAAISHVRACEAPLAEDWKDCIEMDVKKRGGKKTKKHA